MKYCGKCNQNKEITEFHSHKGRKDGLQSECKSCQGNYIHKFNCTSCGKEFETKVRKRKLKLCNECLKPELSKATTALNVARSKLELFNGKGYKVIKDNKSYYVFEHRKVLEEHLDRKLKPNEVVHHIDCNKRNNIVSNLFLTDRKGHAKAHASLDQLSYQLIQSGIIEFDVVEGIYKFNVGASLLRTSWNDTKLIPTRNV